MVSASAVGRWLTHPSAAWWIVVAGTLLASTAVGAHMVFDDYILGLVARGEPDIVGLKQGGLDLFAFTTGLPSDNRALVDQGVMLPWWSDEALKIAFFRPLSSLSHHVDYLLWPGVPELMYLHSLVWLGLTLYLVRRLYLRFESPFRGTLAALLFALDHTHAPVVAWLSNRNALLATSFAALAVSAHDRARRDAHRPSSFFAPLWSACALAAGEFGIATFAYIFAHALFLDRSPVRERARALLPHGIVVLFWAAVYRSSGASVRGSGSYVSPLEDPLRFLSVLPERAFGLLGSAFGAIPADLLMLGRPEHAPVLLGLAAAVLAATAYAILPTVRRDPVGRFWLAGALMAVVPVCASFPSDRLLLLVSVGVMGLGARIVGPLIDTTEARFASRFRAAFGLAFALCHLFLSPLLIPLRAAQMQVLGRALERSLSCLSRARALADRTVVIVNAPLDVFASYAQPALAWQRAPRPQHLYWLTSASSELRVTRPDARTLTVERAGGFLSTALERHYRDQADSLNPASPVELARMSVHIEQLTPDGRPLSVSFRFRDVLESSAYLFLAWRQDRYEPLTLPPIEGSITFPAEDLGAILARAALEVQ